MSVSHRRRLFFFGMGAVFFFSALVFYFSLSQPLFINPYSPVLFARDGRMLGAKVATDGQWRFPALPRCPERFAQAVIAFEDRRFYSHPGLDPLALARATVQNLRQKKIVSGASTLTMQVIRMSRSGYPRNIGEKLMEMALALRLTLAYSKTEVLALYASHAPFGGNVVGLSAASWRYFGRDPQSLSWAEAALLAVLPNSPAMMHPGRNREPLRQKRNRLLVSLWHQRKLDSVTCALSQLEPLPDRPIPLPREASHYLARMHLHSPARSTLNADMQNRINTLLERQRKGLEGEGIFNAAAMVIHVPTGEVLAYVGNLSGTGNGHDVDIIPAPRSTGSLLKPFLYAAMLQVGEIVPSTLIPDIPTQIGDYAPENFDRGYEGAVPARMALARSLNVPAVRMLKEYGIDRFLQLLRELGLSSATRSADDYGLTLVLGGAEGTLWDLCHMYVNLARTALARDTTKSAIGPAAAWLALQAMAEVSRPDAEKYWRNFISSRWVAWKTGTSFGFRDAWAVGVTPEYMVGVWVGNATGQGRPGMTGVQVAAPILFEVFNQLPPTTTFPQPIAAMRRIAVCRQSGMRPAVLCPFIDSVWIPTEGLRSPACPYHRMVHLDVTGTWQVHNECESVNHMRNIPWFVLPPTQEWYYRQRHSDYQPLPPWRKDCESTASYSAKPHGMELIYPRGNAAIYIPIDWNARKSQTVFEAVHRDPTAKVYWYLDQLYLGQTQEFHKREMVPSPGPHVLLLIDNHGERLEHRFEVLTQQDTR